LLHIYVPTPVYKDTTYQHPRRNRRGTVLYLLPRTHFRSGPQRQMLHLLGLGQLCVSIPKVAVVTQDSTFLNKMATSEETIYTRELVATLAEIEEVEQTPRARQTQKDKRVAISEESSESSSDSKSDSSVDQQIRNSPIDPQITLTLAKMTTLLTTAGTSTQQGQGPDMQPLSRISTPDHPAKKSNIGALFNHYLKQAPNRGGDGGKDGDGNPDLPRWAQPGALVPVQPAQDIKAMGKLPEPFYSN
jgi:hypothetical protein